jgi:Zn-dependent peptidase ImmA (M78 family)
VRRGFKAEAERIATETRLELGLGRTARLEPMDLARHLAIPVLTMQQLGSYANGTVDYCAYFSTADPDSFSAVTIFVQRHRRLIVHNENHHPHRQASNLSHEISHTLLEHAPTSIVGTNGQRFWNAEVEQEATWLGAALLVPREGALQLAWNGANISEIAAHFGVSESLCSWRIVQTGIRQQVERSKRWYG